MVTALALPAWLQDVLASEVQTGPPGPWLPQQSSAQMQQSPEVWPTIATPQPRMLYQSRPPQAAPALPQLSPQTPLHQPPTPLTSPAPMPTMAAAPQLPMRQRPEAVVQQAPPVTREKAIEPASHTAQMQITKKDGTPWGEVYLVSPSKKISTEQFTAALQTYQQNNKAAIMRGITPPDIIGDIRIMPVIGSQGAADALSSVMGAGEMLYQQHARPFIHGAIQDIFPEPLQEPVGKPVANVFTPETVPGAAVTGLGILASAGLGTAPAAASVGGRTLQRTASAALPPLVYGAAEQAETGQFPATNVAAMTGVNLAAQYLTSKIAANLHERQQQDMTTKLMRALQETTTLDPVTGARTPVYRDTHRTIAEMLQAGYDALNDQLPASITSLRNLLHTTGGVSAVNSADATLLNNAVSAAATRMDQFLKAAPGADITHLRAGLQSSLDTVMTVLNRSFTNLESIPNRVSVLSNMVARDPQMLTQLQGYTASLSGIDRRVADFYLSGRTGQGLNIGYFRSTLHATAPQIENAFERVWDRLTGGLKQDITRQLYGILYSNLSGVATLDAFRQANNAPGDFIPNLQTHLKDHGHTLFTRLQQMGQQLGTTLFGPAATAQQLQSIAFRGGAPGVDDTAKRLLGVRMPLPFTEKKLPVGVPLGERTNYTGRLQVPTLTPLQAAGQAAVNPLVIRELSEREPAR